MAQQRQSLYKSHGVLWRPVKNDHGQEWLADVPLCPTVGCHTPLQQQNGNYYCVSCEKEYKCAKSFHEIITEAGLKFQGHLTLGYDVYSLDLPPTKVVDEDKQDEHYWVQARISEKEGKRMAVIYFGERTKGIQDKKDYSQIFLDFEDEQLRFDKGNRNPMRLLAKLVAEFPDSKTSVERKDPQQ